MNANQLKVKFIEWLINTNDKNIVIGNEVLFSVNKCRADIVMLKNNKTFAYEIKSDADNFLDFNEQILNYISTFNYTYLVITSKHEKQIDFVRKYNIGILLYKEGNFITIKKPTLSKQISKANLLEFLKKADLISLINKKGYSKYSVFNLRSLVGLKYSTKRIQDKCFETLNERYSILYNLFLDDVTKDGIMIEDLKSLTGNITNRTLCL